MLEDRILYVDAEAIVIDKPAGLPVDPPRDGGDSVAARAHELKLGFQREPVAMHRLDRDTSGCLLLARNPKSRARFQQAFEDQAHRIGHVGYRVGLVADQRFERLRQVAVEGRLVRRFDLEVVHPNRNSLSRALA